jgi:hypothetical protein
MAWHGYVSYAGNEIINAPRTEAYAATAGLPWFRPVYRNDSLAPMLGDPGYHSPLVDDAPWTDPVFPESYRFYGLFPLDIAGLEDSTRSSTVVESTGNGGNSGRLRHGSRSVVFSGLLIAEDDAAAEYGMQWLKQALLGGACGPNAGDCSGDDLCYLAYEPFVDVDGANLEIAFAEGSATFLDLDGGGPSDTPTDDVDGGGPTDDDAPLDYDGGTVSVTGDTQQPVLVAVDVTPEECLTPLLRNMRKVTFNAGPSITGKNKTSDGATLWTVTFTAVAGDPFVYGDEVEVINGFLDPDVDIPWAGGEAPAGGVIDLDGAIYTEDTCAEPVFSVIQDPLAPALIPPPLPPDVPIGNFDPPANWRRRQITIPASYIPLWGEVVPRFQVHAREADLRNLRLRFYADTDGDGDIGDDPCAFCGDLIVSYVPQGFTLVFDAAAQQVYAFDSSQQRRPVTNLVFSSDGTPFDWPVLTCGTGYIVTLDLPQTQQPPVFDLSLFSRAA